MARSSAGKNSARPISPSVRVLWVRPYACQPSAVCSAVQPRVSVSCAPSRRATGRLGSRDPEASSGLIALAHPALGVLLGDRERDVAGLGGVLRQGLQPEPVDRLLHDAVAEAADALDLDLD